MIDQNVIDGRLYDVYSRFIPLVRDEELIADRPHLSCEDVLDAHFLIAEHFRKLGEGIGGFGPKDIGLLSSAVARQVTTAGGSYVYNDAWEIAASLLFGLINNHPFHDANKRTAFLSVVFFMLEQGYVPRTEISEVEDFTVEIAEHNSRHGKHMQVEEIWPKLKTMFRARDNRVSYVVTYRELDQILRQHNCSLRDPVGNYIDVYKGDHRVAKIGYPGPGTEVGRKAIATVRKQTGLTADNGYDAQVFFKGEDPLSKLIGLYEEPLKRLADR